MIIVGMLLGFLKVCQKNVRILVIFMVGAVCVFLFLFIFIFFLMRFSFQIKCKFLGFFDALYSFWLLFETCYNKYFSIFRCPKLVIHIFISRAPNLHDKIIIEEYNLL